MAERPLYTLYKNLKAQNYDVPNDYDKFESALTRDGKSGADNRHAIYENLKAQNFDVPDTYERFYSALFEPRSKTSSRAKGGSVPMSAADRARFSAGAAAISASAQQTMNNVGRYNRLKQRKQKQQKDFGRVNLGTHKTAFGGDANNVVKDDFAYNPETGKAGAYVTSDNDNAYTQNEAEQKQAILDEQNNSYQQAVDTGEIPSVLDVRDKNGNYDLQENIGKNGTYLTEEGAQRQFDKKLADAYARKKEIEALIAEDNRQHGNPLLSYGASIGAGNGRTAQQSDYRNKLATSLSLVTEQIGALEAVKQYPTSSWGEDALKALDNTVFTAKTWDFGLTDFATMGQMERIKTKMDNNIPLSGSDNILLKSKLGADAAAALEDEKMGNIYRWTKIAGQSLPFMADFFLTGGYGGITKGISSGALKIAAKRGMGKVSAAILKNTGIVAGDIIGSYAMAGTEQAMKTGADIMQRHLGNLYQDEKGDYKFGTFDENGNLLHEGGESIGTALYKGLTSAMVENYTEKLFGHNYGIKKGAIAAMEKHGMDGTAQFFKNIGKSGWYTNSKKWMEKFGINGFGEEVMEEEIGIPLHALLDGDNNFSDLGDAKQQLDIIGGMAISVGSMYAMGAGSRPIKGIYNRAQYYRFRNKVNVADNDAQSLFGDNWADIKDKIDNATNEQMGGVLADILRQRDTMNKEQINAAVNYGVNLMKMRGYNIAKTAEMNAKEIANEPTTPEEQHQADIDNAYSEGHDADDADKHNIQLEQNDKANELAAMLHVTPEQLHDMADEDLEAMTGQNDKLDQAIYDYQVSTAKYQGVMDGAQDEVDMAAHQAAMETDNMTDLSRGTVRKATIKATGGLEDYEVYIISGNIATHDDGSIDVGNSDDMIIYYDPTTGRKEHADAMMFADLIEELPAADVKAQAINDAKENAIKKIAGIIDGTVEVGSQFSVTDADGTEHTYEVLADNGDGTAMITIDGSVPTELVKGENVQIPYSFADLQQMKDMEDQKRLETAKAEREQIEKERAAKQTQETEETQSSFDFNQILNDDGNVVLVDVLDEDGNTKYPNSKLFLIRDTGAKAKVVELKSDGTIVPHAVNKEDVATISSMSLDEYKKAMPESSMIEDNSGENRGEIEVETPTIEGETAAPAEETAAPESAETPATEQTPAMTLEDGTEVPMLEDGNPDFSKLTAEQTAELYDSQFGEDADGIVSGYVSDAKKALDKANNMTVKGKNFVEQKAAKQAKEKAIADAQAAYDSAVAIRDAYNERQLAKVEDTADGRKNLIEKARRRFSRLKSAVKDDAEAVAQIYKETVGSLLHRLYDGTGIDVTDTIPLTAEEYVASNLGAHSINYEGTETSKGVKQETGLSREDFAKTQLLAADGKGTTIDNLVHSLWENRPSNLDSLNTQDIRNALIGVLTSGFKASEARSYVENIRIAQAEKLIEEERTAAENATYYEQQKAKEEEEKKKAELEKKAEEENKKAKEEKTEDNEQTKFPDKLKEGSKAIEAPGDATDEKPFGEQLDEANLPFSAKENGKQQTTSERAADVEKNKVDDMKVVDNIVGQKTRKAFDRLAKMMGANIQWQYSDKLGNGWIQETKDADGNVHRTIFITLDSSITEGAQFIFGHEMTHQIKNLNPAAYNELTQLVLDTYGSDAFDKAVDETMQRYSDAGFSGRDREYYAEEVVADSVGEMIRDLNLAHTLAMKMSHPLLAAIHEILQKIKLAFFGTEYSDVTKNIIRSIEQAYVKTANGEVTNSETGEDVSFSLRQKPEPKKKGVGYKVFVLKDGKLYPPMVANPNGAATPVGVWLDADAAPIAGESKTGRPQVKQGGKGTQGGSGKLAYRPGWHLGVVPYAIQFNRKDAEGNKTLFPKNFVFAEVEYAADVDYQEEARQEGINPSGKYQHSLAGLKHLPTDGYYMYRTNPNPETDPWVITGAMKVNRILTRAEQAELVKNAGREPQQIQEGDIVTDDVVDSINQEIADAPKFSIKTYHGSQASFDKFDHSFMGSGEGAQAYGWGTYVSEVEGIAKAYAKANAKKNAPSRLMYQGKPMTYKTPSIIYQVALDMDKFNISAKEAISKMIDADEKKLASVGDTPFAKMKAKQVQDELKVLKDLNPSDFKINEDYDTVAQDLIDTKSGLDLLEDELKDAKSYVDLYQSRLDEAKEELSKAKESGTGLGVDMYESDVEYYSEQVKRYKQSIKTKESDIKDVKNKVDALQKKLDSMEKPRNLYSVDIPDDTGDNYLGWDEPLNAKQIDMWKKALLSAVPESDRAYYKEWADGMLENRKKENNPLTGKDAYYAIDSKYASKKTSMALSKAGFVGVKVIAQRNTGGNKEGKMNYVIFDENNAQITSHTKFSLKKDGLTPEIANTPVNIVDADEEHGFKNYAEAREWAKKNIVRTYNDEETGGKGEINISNTAVGKYLSEKAIDKSISKDVHMSVLKVLPSVLRESVDAYQHGDRKKVNNVRSEKFGINPDVMIHRCFGAVNIGGKVYGVKITLKENVKTRENKKLYSYEATKIELLDGKNEGVTMTPSLNSNNSITVAKIAKVFETAKKNGEKFSLKDEKTLAGVHNITEEKLRKALKLGGFANPSLAVIDTNKTGHDNFGEISFIAPSALLDKRTGNTGGTWITDAYTQRYPSIEREMSEKGSQKFKDWVDSLEYPSEAKAEIKRQAEDALSNNNAPAWELMYLKEKGIDIKEYDSRIDYRWKEIISDHPTAEDILNSMKTDPELNEKVTSLAKHAIIHPTWEKVSLEVRRKMYKETGVKASPINPQVRKQTKEIFERDYAPTLLNKDGSPRKKDVKKVVEDIVKEHNDTKKYDFYLSKVKASNYVNKNGLYDDYIRWQENKLDEFGTKNRIFRGYTKDGSRKYVPETLENVSKAMREEADGQTNGSEYTSFGSFIAKLASRVDSTDEMRANKDKLSSNKDKEEFYEKWNGVYYDLAKFLYNDVFYGEQRLHDIVLQSDPKKYAKKEYGITLTPTFMKKLDALKNAVQTELKSAYFETKYNRPLRLNEFAAAVVPNNLGDDVRKGISDAGLPMYDYDPKKDGDRSRAFNEAINSSDNIRFSLKDEKEKIVADAKANGTYMIAPNGEKTKLDAEQWATVRTTNFKNWFGDWENDPENASKVVDENGEPLVAYHGTTNDETTSVWNEKTKMYDTSHEPFTVFKREVDGLPNSGLFFNSSEDNAYEYGYNNYAVYLSAKNPLVIDCKGSLYNSIKHDGKTMDTYDWANWAEENGYDGVIFKNIKDGVDYGSMQDTTDDYVVFKSNQIKSAENNNGDFSADNNDIRFSLKSMMAKPEGWKQANKKAIHIAEAIERDPKFSLKNLDGTLIKAGTYFSGGGLVEEGLKGIIDPVVAVEYDEKISGVYRNNFGQHIVTADVRDVDPKDLVKQIDGEVEYFHASPVCKNYSQAKNNHAEVELDKETAASTAEFINAVKPKVVTIENVKGYKDSDAMKTITDALDANGYTWDADVYNAADFGGYTNRERLIVRAVRDGKLPAKPKKMEHKSGWYEAVADIIPTLTEKKNGVANWMDVRLKADGIDWRNIDKPLYVMGSAYADGKIPHAFADELLPTLRTKSGDVIVMPDGKVYRAMGRVLARVSGVSDDYKMPFSESLSHTIIGNGIPTQLTEHVIAPLVQNTLRPTPEDGNTKFSLRGSTPYDKQMEEWMEKNHLEKGAVPMEKPIMKEGENIFDYANRMVEWTRNQNLWKTAPKQTGFQDALDKWKADNGLSPDAYPPVRPHREYYSSEIGYSEDLEEYNKKKVLWKSAPKPKDFDLSVDLEDMNKQLRNIRRAVLNQKNYDQRTVKAVSDLVRKMLNIGWGDGLSRGKVGNLLSAAKNATGANDVKKYLDKAMGILAENYLNRLSTAYDNLINTKGARADQSGVIKMGSLDAKGQAFMSEYKKAINMDDKSLNNYIANIEEDSAKNEDNVEMNDYRLAGIQAAIMYKQQIGGNDADISELKRQIDELKNKKDATKEDKDLLKSLEKKLFENKFDRITMYENLLNNIQRMVKESKGRAKEFREEIAEHKNEILYRANLDLEGVDSTYYDTTTAKKKLVNNDLQRAVFSSTYTFEQFLKFFGKKAANGEGRLYNYFTKLNQDALDEEQLYNEMNRNALDEKTKELFGKNKFMNLVGIDGKDMKEMDVEVTDYSNKETGKRTIHLKQGQMLYIYLVNKETDGEMKLRAMGITEEDVAAIEENLDPRVKAMGEWLQDEYLPECQRRYQATHTKYFGAPMKEVENYFPLAINNRARNVKEDVNQDSDAISQLAGTSTGAIVTRRVNVIPLDIENADAFEVAFNHLQEMEEWSAMLPFRQDINTLLSYTHFRNQVQNMSSVAYGSGKTLWDEFKQTAQIAAGTYKPKVNAGMMDSRIAAAMGGIAVAKISGRLWTAIKQSQSATVFLPECDFTRFVKNGVNPYGSWKWAMENIPDFRKRVENMTYGDVKLRQYLDELEKWHDWTKTISKIGMAPNILVDGITCAVGARSVYETEVNRLTKLGYPKEKAEEKAYYKAVAAYNKTQQSSGGMYLSPMQVDRTYVSAALSLFKNANYAYGRMQIEACRGLARTYDFWGGKHKTTLIESMTRQIMEEDGLDENTARAIAKATYNRTFRQSIGRLINFATLVPVSWALYKVLPYLLTGDDDDKKNDMIEEAVLKGFATSLSDNYVIPFASNILNAGLKVEDGKPTFDPEVFRYQNLYINPATSDLANIYSMVGNQKWYSVANKLGMLGVQSLIGFNPETVGALYQAFAEADYDNGNTAKEWQIGILKAISAPEESIRELYMDELGLKSGDIKKIPLAELEKRYAERQINRDNLLSQIGMDAETFNGYVDKYQKSFEKKIKDKMDKWDEYNKKKADEFFDTTSDPKLKDMIEKKRAKDANAAADEQIAKEGLNQEKKGKEPSEEAYDAVKMSIDVAEDNAISTYNKVLNKRYAALNDEYNNQTDAMKYIFMSKHPNFKAYKDLESEYTTYGKKMKELKEKLVSADGYDAKQTILKQIRAEREKFSELQSKVR